MAIAIFPQTIYITQRFFNDYGADDMRYGDMCEKRLKHEFGLFHLSSQVGA